jgi:hypothetical protein
VFAVLLPKILDPELNTTDELTVVTTSVCAVKVPLINAAEAVIAPKTFWLPVNMLEPVVAYVLSICVTRVEKEPDAPSKDVVLVEKEALAATKLDAVASVLVTLEEKEELSLVILVENDALAATKLDAVVSVFVTLVEKDPDAVSKLVSLVEIEPDPK